MANALKNPPDERTCLEYFELEQSPFACLPDTSPLFRTDQNSLLESRLRETMSDTDSLLVLRGADGAGKTTLVRQFLGGLGDATLHALIDETCKNGNDFYCSFLRQMGFEEISGKLKELRTIAREFLVHRVTAGDPVPLVLDNAPRIPPTVLEQLHWVAGIRHKGRRVLSVVITGNSELERILEAPAMSNLRSTETRIFHVRALTEDETDGYIEHRLALAGAKDKLKITPAARGAIHRFSGGLPGAIDRIGNLLLIEAANRETSRIDDTLVLDVAEAEQLPINVFPMEARGRRKTDALAGSDAPDANVAGLHNRIEELTAEVNQLEAEKAEAADLVDSQNVDVSELRKKLASNEIALRRSASDAKKLAAESKRQAPSCVRKGGQPSRRKLRLTARNAESTSWRKRRAVFRTR